MSIALDATYSIGAEPTGVGVYCAEMLAGITAAYPQERFLYCYRPHRYWKSWSERIPCNARRFLLHDRWRVPARAALFHGLNQRMPDRRLRSAVCTFHDLFVLTNEYSTPEFRQRFAALAKHAAERSDLIITVSRFTAEQVSGLLHVEPSRLRVVHHGVRPLPQRLGKREPMVLHVGAIQRRKNVARLVRAFESTPAEWRLVLAGAAGYGSEEAMKAIETSPARSRITVTGYVTVDQLADLYSRASVFAFPSLAEGFGMPVLEAMAQGIPVVSSNSSAMPEVCGDAALLVDPEDTDAISGALRRLIDDSALWKDLSVRGSAWAARFTWSRAVQQTCAVYKELGGLN